MFDLLIVNKILRTVTFGWHDSKHVSLIVSREDLDQAFFVDCMQNQTLFISRAKDD